MLWKGKEINAMKVNGCLGESIVAMEITGRYTYFNKSMTLPVRVIFL
jgi:hypothetical protein